jgi:Sigma-70 region 2
MEDRGWLTERFQEHHRRLRAVAYRMLGSLAEADDAVQRLGCGYAALTPARSRTSAPG